MRWIRNGLLLVLLIGARAASQPVAEALAEAKSQELSRLRAGKGDPCAEGIAITCGQTLTGSLVLADDCPLGDGTVFDLFTFAANAGQRITADLVSSAFDSYLILTDDDFNTLAEDDDGGGGFNSRIEYQFSDSRQAFLAVNSVFTGEGDYSLTLNCSEGFAVSGQISGSWYDPSHDGEGWKIEILDADTAVIYWFTYPPPGSGARQAWVFGLGRIEGNRIIVDQGLIPSGGRFGPNFDPGEVNREPWGSFTFAFSGPDAGRLDYQGPENFGSGSLDIVRLTSIAAPSAKGEASANVGPGVSGSWYDPSHDGEGWIIEVIDAVTAVIYWFTYDADGNQAWNIGIGQLKGNQIVVAEAIETEGADFGPTFDPDQVVRTQWGGYVFAFDGCDQARMSYANQHRLGFDHFQAVRLTSLRDVPCTPFDLQQSPVNTVATNAGNALLLNSLRQDGYETDFFGAKSASGEPQRLAGMKIKDPAGKTGDVLTDGDSMPSRIRDAEEGDTVGIQRTDDPNGAWFSGLTKDGALQSLIAIALENLDGGGKRLVERIVRDAPMRPGRATGWISAVPRGARFGLKGVNQSTVSVSQCGVPLDNAFVEARISSASGEFSIPRPLAGIPLGQGQYRLSVPNGSTTGSASPGASCERFVATAGEGCAFVDRIEALDIPEICALISGAMVAETSTADDLSAAAGFLESCAFGLYATKLSCDSAGGGAASAGQSRQDFVCADPGEQDNSVVELLPAGTTTIAFEIAVRLPGRGGVQPEDESSRADAPIDGPYPDFDIDLMDPVTIADFFTAPASPRPLAPYTATARITCAPPNTRVTMSISGSEGFSDSIQCTINGSGDCNLQVPGATGAGVRDTITVSVADGPSRQIQIIF